MPSLRHAARQMWRRAVRPAVAGEPKALFEARFDPLMRWPEFNNNVNVSLQSRYTYVETAKTACSTIKFRLMHAMDPAIVGRIDKVHLGALSGPFIRPYQLPGHILREALFGSFYRFTFVRNPFTRILSAYLNKVGDKRVAPMANLRTVRPDLTDESEISFVDFLRIVREMPDVREMDKHWRPTTALTFHGTISYDFIGRFERFEEDWGVVAKALSLPPNRASFDPHATGADALLRKHYTDEAVDLVRKIYADDFEAFGYSTDLPV